MKKLFAALLISFSVCAHANTGNLVSSYISADDYVVCLYEYGSQRFHVVREAAILQREKREPDYKVGDRGCPINQDLW